jgi:hypothetical protein
MYMKRIVFILCLVASMPARADDAKPIDLTKQITDLSGRPIMEPGPNPGDPALPMTVGSAAGSCLAKEAKGPAYWALAQRLAGKEPVTLTTAEVHAIVGCVDKLPAIISGQVDPLIDPTYKMKPVE